MGGGIPNPIEKIIDIGKKIVDKVVNLVGDVVNFVLSPFGAFDVPNVNIPNAQNAAESAQGVTVTKNSTNAAVPIVYGYRRVGGALVYAETGSTNNQYLYTAYALCEGPIQGIKRILVDDVALPLPSNFYTDGAVVDVTSGKFNGRIKFQVRYGYQATNSNIDSNLRGPSWNKRARPFTRAAFVVMRFYWKEIKTQKDADNNPFRGGIPQVKFDVLGKRVPDIRKYSQPFSNFSYNPTSSANVYSFNPANCLLDYMLNPVYGAGLSPSQIDLDSFKICAKKYAQTVTYYDKYEGPAWTLNAVIDTNVRVLDNLKTMLANMRGILTFTRGKYKLKIEDGGNFTSINSSSYTAAFIVTRYYVVGGITLNGERKKTKYNQVIVNWIDPDREFTNQQQVYEEAADLALDNNEKLVGEFTFHGITNPSIAWETARMIYKKSRTQKTIQFKGTPELLDVEIGSIIQVTDTVLQLSLKPFRVISMQLGNDMTVDITAVEHNPLIYPAVLPTFPIVLTPAIVWSTVFPKNPVVLVKPDELTVRPRKRGTTLEPIGLVPPNDPDAPVTVVDSAGDPVLDSAGNTQTTPVIDSAGEPIVDSAGAPAGDPEEGNPLQEEEVETNVVRSFQKQGVFITPTGPRTGDEELLQLIDKGIVVNPVNLENENPGKSYSDGTLPYILYNPFRKFGNQYFTNVSNVGLMTTPDLRTTNGFTRNYVQTPSSPVIATLADGTQYIDRRNYRYVGEHWSVVFTDQMALNGGGYIYAAMQANIPQDTAINGYRIDYENEDGETWYYGTTSRQGNFETPNPGMTAMVFNSVPPYDPADPTKQARTKFPRNCRFKWTKIVNDSQILLDDGSVLSTSYTWFDYSENKSKTGQTINDFMNYWLQNADSLWKVSGQTSSSQTTVSTSHNLGG